MKNIRHGIIMAIALLVPTIVRAQGIVYISGLGQSSNGNATVGSDSWLAAAFSTGANAGGYTLDSIQLAMTAASGSPSGFSVMLYSAIDTGEAYPGSDIGTLSGSTSPSAGGLFTYTPASDITLSPDTPYFIVLTAGTDVATGAYQWSMGNGIYNQSSGWMAQYGISRPDDYQSVDGSGWGYDDLFPQYAVTATPTPEPATPALIGLGVLGFLWHRRKAMAHLKDSRAISNR
jgi:hypothetical protein